VYLANNTSFQVGNGFYPKFYWKRKFKKWNNFLVFCNKRAQKEAFTEESTKKMKENLLGIARENY
ncbi:MAG: hypothetical protein ACRDE7_08150, partial [Sphingobacterium sp.]